jgi:IS30 family transposase
MQGTNRDKDKNRNIEERSRKVKDRKEQERWVSKVVVFAVHRNKSLSDSSW